MKAFTHESGFAVLVIAAVTALVVGLALAGSGACW
jgi:hypothetical protein